MKTELSISLAAPNDRVKLKEIIDLSFPRFFRFFAAHSIDSREGKILVAQENQAVEGFAKLIEFNVNNKKYGCILWLAVHPYHRRKNIASTLVEAGVENLKRDGVKSVFVSVQRKNKASLSTFAKESFARKRFVDLWRLFGWRIFEFYGDIWLAPGEVVLMKE